MTSEQTTEILREAIRKERPRGSSYIKVI